MGNIRHLVNFKVEYCGLKFSFFFSYIDYGNQGKSHSMLYNLLMAERKSDEHKNQTKTASYRI